jgi:hypothetical protein
MFGPTCEVIPEFSRRESESADGDLDNAILEMIRRRSLTMSDILNATGVTKSQALESLDRLIRDRKIKKAVHGGQAYYREFY